ncbi:uncharacterized protein LOC131437483 [Malaya genurostris]|uniref:uncharacterized protein LOC131437483 n=1 Tax=Malaya genurostris TaxID=325434 RepID=UPI0026F3B24B|nr:uncharacterized protein LOC131437483 [Malaya genurostris]
MNYSIINMHCPHETRPDDKKEVFLPRQGSSNHLLSPQRYPQSHLEITRSTYGKSNRPCSHRRAILLRRHQSVAGNNQLPGELLKHGGEALARALHWMISRIWEEEILPQEWMDGVVCPVYKKGDKLDCCNYRAITLLNAAYKVLSQILYRRLSPIAKEIVGPYQAGFTGARATTDHIFALLDK